MARQPKWIMVFGDSNSWGWIPATEPPSTRFAAQVRWPGALQAELGEGDHVTAGSVDGVHFTADNHRALSRAVAQHVKIMLPADQEER